MQPLIFTSLFSYKRDFIFLDEVKQGKQLRLELKLNSMSHNELYTTLKYWKKLMKNSSIVSILIPPCDHA